MFLVGALTPPDSDDTPSDYVPNGLSGYIQIPLSSLTELLSQLLLHCSLKASPHLQIVYPKTIHIGGTRAAQQIFLTHCLQFRQLGSSLCAHQRGSHIAPLTGVRVRESQFGKFDPMILLAVCGLRVADPHGRLSSRRARATLLCVG